MRKKFNQGYILRFMTSYLFILMIPLVIGSIAYNNTINVLEKEVQYSNLLMLQQSKDIVDRRLDELVSTVKQVSLNNKVNQFLNMDNPLVDSRAVTKMINAQQSIKQYGLTNNFLKTMFIYSRNSEALISPSLSDVRINEFYGNILNYSDMDYDTWKSVMLDTDHNMTYIAPRSVSLDYSTYSLITLIQTLPYDSKEKLGNVLLLFDEEHIKKLLSKLRIEDGGYAYITDKDGQLITSLTSNEAAINIMNLEQEGSGFYTYKHNGEEMIVSYTISEFNGWQYVAVLPFHVLMAKVKVVQKYIFIIAGITLFIGLCISFVLAYRNGKPLKDIVYTIKEFSTENSGEVNGHINLKSSITKLITSNKELKERMEKQRPLMKRAFLERLLNNSFSSIEELETYLAQINESNIQGKVGVIMIRINDENDGMRIPLLEKYEASKFVIQDEVAGVISTIKYTYDMDYNILVFILAINEDDEIYMESMNKTFALLKSNLIKNYGMHVNVSGGTVVTELLECYRSYNEATIAMDYSFIGKENTAISWYHNLALRTTNFYYPVNIQQQLINLARAGHMNKISTILDEVYNINISQRKLTKGTLRRLSYNMQGTLTELIDVISKEQEYIYEEINILIEQLERNKPFDDVFESIRNVYGRLCEDVNQIKKQRKVQVKSKIMKYIQKHYNNDQLCLAHVAGIFNYSTSHITKVVKENTGLTFSQYVENIRIDKACEYLQGDKNIKEIATVIGYTNAQVFRRAFKRVLGVNPSTYKERKELE